MARESENIINGLEKGREWPLGRIHLAYDRKTIIIFQVWQIHGQGSRGQKLVHRNKVENPARNLKEYEQPRRELMKMYPRMKNNNNEIN